jgi:hypothetical protein
VRRFQIRLAIMAMLALGLYDLIVQRYGGPMAGLLAFLTLVLGLLCVGLVGAAEWRIHTLRRQGTVR